MSVKIILKIKDKYMSLITRVKIGEIRVIVSDIVFYKPLYNKNILETILARVNGNNTVLIKFNSREELEEVVNLLDNISIIKTINNKNDVEDISLNNELDNSSQTTGELIKPIPSESIVKKEWEENPTPKSHKIKEEDYNFPKSIMYFESEDTIIEYAESPLIALIEDIKQNIRRTFQK